MAKKINFSFPATFESGNSLAYGVCWENGSIIKVGSCAATEEENNDLNQKMVGHKWNFNHDCGCNVPCNCEGFME